MSNRLFQSVIHQLRDAINRTIGVIDETGTIVACSELTIIGEHIIPDASEVFSSFGQKIVAGKTFITFGNNLQSDCAVFVDGDDEEAGRYASIIAISLSNIKQYHDEKYDRGNFIKNVILDNILQGDIYLKSRELSFNNEARRCVLLVRVPEKNDSSIFDAIAALFPDRSKDFVINISKTDIVLVKELRPQTEIKDLEKLARSIADTLTKELYISSLIGIGSIVSGIKDLARSFKEAQISLEVGKVFDTEKTIMKYENLGIARLIYQLPTTLCDMFLREVFKRGSIESLDHETLFTIQRFFENNLNVSETSRKLFVHRNTLVYRLEKIKKLTGLDLREFDDAIVFKVALMVKKYLDAKPVKY